MQAGPVQRLVGIDVAQAGDKSLVQQQRLEQEGTQDSGWRLTTLLPDFR